MKDTVVQVKESRWVTFYVSNANEFLFSLFLAKVGFRSEFAVRRARSLYGRVCAWPLFTKDMVKTLSWPAREWCMDKKFSEYFCIRGTFEKREIKLSQCSLLPSFSPLIFAAVMQRVNLPLALLYLHMCSAFHSLAYVQVQEISVLTARWVNKICAA